MKPPASENGPVIVVGDFKELLLIGG